MWLAWRSALVAARVGRRGERRRWCEVVPTDLPWQARVLPLLVDPVAAGACSDHRGDLQRCSQRAHRRRSRSCLRTGRRAAPPFRNDVRWHRPSVTRESTPRPGPRRSMRMTGSFSSARSTPTPPRVCSRTPSTTCTPSGTTRLRVSSLTAPGGTRAIEHLRAVHRLRELLRLQTRTPAPGRRHDPLRPARVVGRRTQDDPRLKD